VLRTCDYVLWDSMHCVLVIYCDRVYMDYDCFSYGNEVYIFIISDQMLLVFQLPTVMSNIHARLSCHCLNNSTTYHIFYVNTSIQI